MLEDGGGGRKRGKGKEAVWWGSSKKMDDDEVFVVDQNELGEQVSIKLVGNNYQKRACCVCNGENILYNLNYLIR